MKREDLYQIGAYATVGLLSVSAAFIISLQFVGKGRAQSEDAPASAPVEQAPTAAPEAEDQSQAAPPPTAPSASAQPGDVNSHTPGDMAGHGPKVSGDLSELEGFLEPFIYDVVNRRDPFMAWAEYVPTEGPSKPLSPAQRFDLDQLSLVGIMWDVKDPKAMFTDPDNEVIVLGRDEGIGNKNGYIASIREGEVVVVEATRKRGDLIYKTRTLRIER